MMIFLQILGGLFLLILLAVGYYGFRFYRRVKSGIAENGDFYTLLGILPPLRFELEQSSGADWLKTEQRDAHQGVLQRNGFTHTGYYHTEIGNSEAKLSLWGNPNKGITVALMEVNGLGGDEIIATYAVDVFVYFTDSSSLTITNNREAGLLPRPAEHDFVYCETQNLKHLFSQIKPNLPKNKLVKPIKDVKRLFCDVFESTSEWVWQELQLKSIQFQDAIAPLDIKVDDDLIEQLLNHARCEKSQLISERILHRVAQAPTINAAKWEEIRERLVVVHDEMQPDDLASCLYELLEHPSEKEAEIIDALSDLTVIDKPLDLFLETLEKLKGSRKIKKITQIKRPVAAHIYLVG